MSGGTRMQTWALERLVLDNSRDVRSYLERYLGRDGDYIYAMAVMRLMHPSSGYSAMKDIYLGSALRDEIPSLSLTEGRILDVLSAFSHSDVGILRFDINHTLSTRHSRLIAMADMTIPTDNAPDVDHISDMRVRIGNRPGFFVYAFDTDTSEPLLFQALNPRWEYTADDYDSMADLYAFGRIMAMGSVPTRDRMGYVVGSDPNDTSYIVPDCEERPSTNGPLAICGRYEVPGRREWYYSFRDIDRACREEMEYLRGRETLPPGFDELHEHVFGTTVYHSNVNIRPERMFEIIRMRETLDTMFRTYSLIPFSKDDDYGTGGMFVGYISTILATRLMGPMRKGRLLKKHTFGDIVRILNGNLRHMDGDGTWMYRSMSKDDETVFRRLGIHPDDVTH